MIQLVRSPRNRVCLPCTLLRSGVEEVTKAMIFVALLGRMTPRFSTRFEFSFVSTLHQAMEVVVFINIFAERVRFASNTTLFPLQRKTSFFVALGGKTFDTTKALVYFEQKRCALHALSLPKSPKSFDIGYLAVRLGP